MHARTTTLLAMLLSAATVATAGAQQMTRSAPQHATKSAMQHTAPKAVQHSAASSAAPAQAKQKSAQRPAISADSARALVLRSMPNAKVRSEKLEHENGRLVYAFHVTPAGKSSSVWLDVDANKGTLSKPHQHATAKKKA